MTVTMLTDRETKSKERLLHLLIRLVTVFLFTGRAWQYLRWDSPWQQVISPQYASTIQVIAGICFIICAGIALGVDKYVGKPISIWILVTGSLMMLVHSLLSSKLQNWNFAQFIEHTLQWTIPLILVGNIHHSIPLSRMLTGMKWAVALTFAGHGMFAAGVYLVPAHFVYMTQSILGIPTEGAKTFLLIAGILDFIVAIGLFIKGFDRYVVFYAIIWGTLTAFARVVAYYDPALPLYSLDRWLFETVYRLGHGGVPLMIFLTSQNSFYTKFNTTKLSP